MSHKEGSLTAGRIPGDAEVYDRMSLNRKSYS